MSFKYLVKEKIIIYKYILNWRSTTHSKINSLKLRLRNVNCNFDKTKSTKIKIYFRRKNKYPTGKNQIGTDSVTRQIEYISVHSNIYLLWNWFFKTKPNIHQRRDLNIALSSFCRFLCELTYVTMMHIDYICESYQKMYAKKLLCLLHNINVFNISGVVPKSRIYCYNNPSLSFDSHRNSEFIPEKKFALVKKD